MLRRALDALLYHPDRRLLQTPAAAGLAYRDLAMDAGDGARLHGWWIPAPAPPTAHVLLCHGNAGNVGDRVLHAAILAAAGLDVLLFDYRGYGRSTGTPGEAGTYRDARAARSALLEQDGVDPARVVYLGESLGGAVALELALEHPPAGLVLQSAFTSVRAMARRHYPAIPAALVPDAYPSWRRIERLRSPLLVVHGERDELVPLAEGLSLHGAAPGPTELWVVPGAGHNDLVPVAGRAYGERIALWATTVRA